MPVSLCVCKSTYICKYKNMKKDISRMSLFIVEYSANVKHLFFIY